MDLGSPLVSKHFMDLGLPLASKQLPSFPASNAAFPAVYEATRSCIGRDALYNPT